MPHERILVVDDEADVRAMCLRTLELEGYDVTDVSDGQEAIERCRGEHYDLLVTDVRMPNLSGLEAYRAIRAFEPDLPAVIMTGFGTLETAIEAMRLGASEFVLKPFLPTALNAAVARALSRQHLERENARLRALIPLFDLSRIYTSTSDLNTIPDLVVRIAKEEMRADSASLMLLSDQQELVIRSADGLSPEVIASTRQKVGEGIAGYVMAHREPVILQGNLQSERRFESTYGTKQITSAISLPLIYKDKALGVLNVAKNGEASPFTQSDVELLSVLGSQVAISLENARLFRETQEAYRRLAELDHLKSEFISIAAHELRSPLAVVLAYATLLEEEAEGPMREHLSQVVQAAMQLKSIIDEMVSLQHIDTGQAQIALTKVCLPTTIDAVLAELHVLAERKSQQVAISWPETLPSVRADQQVLHLILSSLISNAIKFTPQKGTIDISASVETERVIVAIRDTGIGVPPEEIERIFHRFYQVEDSLRRKHGGIGLGLAIAREMAELIDASIRVESQVGQGSTFYLSLAPC